MDGGRPSGHPQTRHGGHRTHIQGEVEVGKTGWSCLAHAGFLSGLMRCRRGSSSCWRWTTSQNGRVFYMLPV
eukprot:280840-Pelagomonas_calceolata.AAC.6